jgi:adenylate cyclase
MNEYHNKILPDVVVNIAAWLQELAEPGGLVVSSTVYDQVHDKLSVGFDCLGRQPMKNVAAVTSCRVTMGGQAVGRVASEAARPFRTELRTPGPTV